MIPLLDPNKVFLYEKIKWWEYYELFLQGVPRVYVTPKSMQILLIYA